MKFATKVLIAILFLSAISIIVALIVNAVKNRRLERLRREEEERERREIWERQRRMMENFTNIPDQLRETYPRRGDAAYNWR